MKTTVRYFLNNGNTEAFFQLLKSTILRVAIDWHWDIFRSLRVAIGLAYHRKKLGSEASLSTLTSQYTHVKLKSEHINSQLKQT